jgi:hypothetical protein
VKAGQAVAQLRAEAAMKSGKTLAVRAMGCPFERARGLAGTFKPGQAVGLKKRNEPIRFVAGPRQRRCRRNLTVGAVAAWRKVPRATDHHAADPSA